MKNRKPRREKYVRVPVQPAFLIYFLIAALMLFYPLLDISCQQPLSAESKPEAILRSTCTLPLNSIVLSGIGLILFVAGVFCLRK